LIANADKKLKAKFYYLKGKALYQNGSNEADIKKVGEAFNQLIDYERGINSLKYTAEVGDLLNKMVADVAVKASKDYDIADQSKLPEDYIKSAKGFHTVLVLSPADTSFLDNAALLYNFGKDYKTSIELYENLLELGYTGISTSYIATNKTDGKDITYSDKKSRDLQVKLGIAENPREETKDSRREVIFKNLAQSYVSLENSEKALEIITLGRGEFPNSYALLIDEANIYYNFGDFMKFKEKLEEAIDLNPTEPSLYYNVGVMNMEQKNMDEAIKNFKKAIELKPDYADAYNNIGAAIIEKANVLIEEMNNNLSNFEKYDKLQAQQMEIYKEAVPYYESAYKYNNSSFSIVQTLMGLYENLEMTDKFNEIKAIYDGLKE